MAMMDSSSWNGQEHSLPQPVEDDFQFLEMGDMSNLGDGMQFDFQNFNGSNNTSMMHSHPTHETLDTHMGGTEAAGSASRTSMGLQSQITSAPSVPSIPTQMISPLHPNVNDTISEIDAQIQFLQQQRIQQQHKQLEEQQRRFEEQQAAFFVQQQRGMVPHTPQSLEMHAVNQYYVPGDQVHHSQGMFDRYPRLKDQHDMAFTPLVSPAVTPLDAHFPVDAQYTIPGAYFSPLTSPALHPQNESVPGFEQRQPGSTTTNSPAEIELEPNAVPSTSVDLPKKVRKGNVSKARKSAVKQSPLSKPQRRKTATTPVMNAQILKELAEAPVERVEQPSANPPSASTTPAEDSENASVSPEALSDMPPPPIPQPRSARQSPYIQAQNSSNTTTHNRPTSLNGAPSPATPASLFRISPKSRSADGVNPGQVASEHIESFELPESANFPKQRLPQLNTKADSQSPPEIETAKVSALQPLPSPVFPKPSRPSSTSESPQLTPKSSVTFNPRKTPLLAPRGSKKRSSISSVHVSPALLPRISPNIKPLLPGTPGMSAEDTASRLLTSKSNYQNILEGNTVPGVSYPSELSTNLTSKRTSHKIAEQGRRNRINSALLEIATLLPKSVTKDLKVDDGDSQDGEKSEKKDKQGNGPNSKASTVELAIVYIKQLQQEIAEANQRADEAEKKLGMKTAVS